LLVPVHQRFGSPTMADDLKNRGGRDRTRIDVNQDYELRDWSKKFGVTKEQLKEAVQAVGTEADKVEEHLRGRETGSGRSTER
jgi:hypothetical protein